MDSAIICSPDLTNINLVIFFISCINYKVHKSIVATETAGMPSRAAVAMNDTADRCVPIMGGQEVLILFPIGGFLAETTCRRN